MDGLFKMEHPTRMDDLGGDPILGNLHVQFWTYRISQTFAQLADQTPRAPSFWDVVRPPPGSS